MQDEYEEDHITYEYRSDFDILIITADKTTERNVAYDNDLKQALVPGAEGTRVNPIVHTIHHINQMLAERRYFFMDVLKEGYLLYDSERYKLARPPKELPPGVMLRHAEEYFGEWMESAEGFLDSALYNESKGRPKTAAFDMHQSTERLITCLLLVQTGHRPKEHDLEKLLQQAAGFDPRFAAIFPKTRQIQRIGRHLVEQSARPWRDSATRKTLAGLSLPCPRVGSRPHTGGGFRIISNTCQLIPDLQKSRWCSRYPIAGSRFAPSTNSKHHPVIWRRAKLILSVHVHKGC